MSIEDIINRIIELRHIKQEKELREIAKALKKLQDDLHPLGLSVAWSRSKEDWVVLVNKEQQCT